MHPVTFSWSDIRRNSSMYLGLSASKCVWMSTMRSPFAGTVALSCMKLKARTLAAPDVAAIELMAAAFTVVFKNVLRENVFFMMLPAMHVRLNWLLVLGKRKSLAT